MSAEPRFPTSESPDAPAPRLSLVHDPETPTVTRTRKPLVRTKTGRAPARRWLVLASITAMVAALLFTLVLSITMSTRQYDLVELRATEKLLIQENEALAQEIEYHQAPQDLAIRASQLGMVASASQATLNLHTGEVLGVAAPAQGSEEARKNLIDPPALADTRAYEQASQRAAEEKKKEEAAAKASASAAAASASASAEPGATQPSVAQPSAAQPSAVQPSGANR